MGLPYPNPFWPARGGKLSIDVTVVNPGTVSIKAFNLAGVLVRTISSGFSGNGKSTFTWDGRNEAGDLVATGMYMLLIEEPGLSQTRLAGVLK